MKQTKNYRKHIICFILAPLYRFSVKFRSWYRKYTNTCKNGCENCYNYGCVLKRDKNDTN